jgi:hypothetical protein
VAPRCAGFNALAPLKLLRGSWSDDPAPRDRSFGLGKRPSTTVRLPPLYCAVRPSTKPAGPRRRAGTGLDHSSSLAHRGEHRVRASRRPGILALTIIMKRASLSLNTVKDVASHPETKWRRANSTAPPAFLGKRCSASGGSSARAFVGRGRRRRAQAAAQAMACASR